MLQYELGCEQGLLLLSVTASGPPEVWSLAGQGLRHSQCLLM